MSGADSFKGKRIWIYGIGVIGKRLCQIFDCLKLQVEGIVVSSSKDNIDCFLGIPIYEFNESMFNEDDLVVITVEGNAGIEIEKKLMQYNIQNISMNSDLLNSLWKKYEYHFDDRTKGKEKLCLVLAGYKDYLWENVFKRLKEYAPNDVEICLCSAGKCVDRLKELAKEYNWSYLYTETNSVSLIQNISISLHPSCKWIYKMDEDMFVTKGVFENLLMISEDIIKSGMYDFGVCSPIIPVNAIGYRLILEKYNLLDSFEQQFGKALIGGSPKREIEKNPEAAKFMWSNYQIPQIDQLAIEIQEQNKYIACSNRLSIGFVLFQRELWENLQGFLVYGNRDLGIDEEDIISFCVNNSKIMAIALNSVVGHFAFGKQTQEMIQFYLENRERF